jgi:predicted Zn finger-like uncharacterized protein
MDVRCDKCQARYRIDDARVGPKGLNMKCGKCGNTFSVTKDAAAAPSAPPPAPASKPAPAAAKAEPAANATMVFGQAPVIAKPAPKPAPAPAGDGAGSTMMFGQSPVPAAVAAAALGKPSPKPAPKVAENDSGSTMVFGAAPVLPKPAPTAMPKASSSAGRPAPAAADGAGSTMMFGQSPIAAKPPAPPAPKPPPPAPPPPAPAAPEPAAEDNSDATVEATDDEIPTSHSQSLVPKPESKVESPAEEQSAGHDEAARPGKKPQAGPVVSHEEPPGDVDSGAMTSELQDPPADAEAPAEEAEAPPEEEGALSKGPSKKLLLGLGAAAALIFVVLGGLVVVKKMGPKPPPEEALQALEQGRALLDKDSLATFTTALSTTVAALEAAPKSPFGEAHAVRAEIEIAWSEALTEQASLLEDKAQRADDDKVKSEASAASEKAKTDAKAHLKAALEATQAGFKAEPKSPDVAVALLDYYRVNKSDPNFRKQLKKTAELKADEAKVALVEGLKLLGEEDGAEKALPKLKAALAANPKSARVEYRIARAYLAMKNEAEALKALQETLKLSGSHERAQAALNDLQAQQQQTGGDTPAPAPEEKK